MSFFTPSFEQDGCVAGKTSPLFADQPSLRNLGGEGTNSSTEGWQIVDQEAKGNSGGRTLHSRAVNRRMTWLGCLSRSVFSGAPSTPPLCPHPPPSRRCDSIHQWCDFDLRFDHRVFHRRRCEKWGKVDARANLEAMVLRLVPSFHKRQSHSKQPKVCSFRILRRASDSSEGWRGRDGNCCRTSDFDDEQFTAGLFR